MQWILGVVLTALGLGLQWAGGLLVGVGQVLEVAGNRLAETDIMP
jgi:hypothetical protein